QRTQAESTERRVPATGHGRHSERVRRRLEAEERQAEMVSPADILGVRPDANPEEIRAAYVRKVKEHPPDRSPEEFERIRDAYETLRDPRRRMREILLSPDPHPSFAAWLEKQPAPPKFLGPAPWIAVLKEGAKRS